MEERWYAAIDLKSFYASVECVERGLDPLDTLLVVADRSRTEKLEAAVEAVRRKHGDGSITLGYQENRDIGVERKAPPR